MGRAKHKLTAQGVERAATPGLYADGGGLFLQVTRSSPDAPVRKSWIVRYRGPDGRTRSMGIGRTATVTLAKARTKAVEARALATDGADPIESRKAQRAKAAEDAAKAVTFQACAVAYIEAHKASWRNAKHADQWAATLKTYADPIFGKRPVAAIDTGLVIHVLDPIWATKTETASRVRGRIEAILDWAKVRGYRSGENPARWRGHLDDVLPKRSKAQRVRHHPSLPYAELPAFVAALRQRPGTSARALEFTILTAARTNEALLARKSEVDLKARLWTLPADRMKAYRDHRVPLSDAVVSILMAQYAAHPDSPYVFPNEGAQPPAGKAPKRRAAAVPLSNMAMLKQLERMGRSDLTTHGFRATFKTWAAERTAFPREVIEAAQAHVVRDGTEAAYMRGDLFDKRAKLMDAWAEYCASTPQAEADNVVSLQRQA